MYCAGPWGSPAVHHGVVVSVVQPAPRGMLEGDIALVRNSKVCELRRGWWWRKSVVLLRCGGGIPKVGVGAWVQNFSLVVLPDTLGDLLLP